MDGCGSRVYDYGVAWPDKGSSPFGNGLLFHFIFSKGVGNKTGFTLSSAFHGSTMGSDQLPLLLQYRKVCPDGYGTYAKDLGKLFHCDIIPVSKDS